jgi:hypothetical protein
MCARDDGWKRRKHKYWNLFTVKRRTGGGGEVSNVLGMVETSELQKVESYLSQFEGKLPSRIVETVNGHENDEWKIKRKVVNWCWSDEERWRRRWNPDVGAIFELKKKLAWLRWNMNAMMVNVEQMTVNQQGMKNRKVWKKLQCRNLKLLKNPEHSSEVVLVASSTRQL